MEDQLLDKNQSLQATEDGKAPDLYDALQQTGHSCPWLGAVAFKCCAGMAEKAQLNEVEQYGEDAFKGESYEYSLFCGKVELCDEKFELEDTETAHDKRRSLRALTHIFYKMFFTGCVIRFLANGGGVAAGIMATCEEGPALYWFACPVLAVIIQLWATETLTRRLSRLSFEGRSLGEMMTKPTGLDKYQVVAVVGILDLFGRFTRASFVGYAMNCADGIDKALVDSFKHSALEPVTPFVKILGLGGMSCFFFIVGPLAISGTFNLLSCWAIKARLDTIDVNDGQSMGIGTKIDDFAAIASWAMLGPITKVFEVCSVPLSLETIDDTIRLWELMKTHTMIIAAKVIPDNIMQMELQARFFGLAFPFLSVGGQINILALAFFPAGIDTLLSGIDLVTKNRVLPVLVGFFLILFPMGCYVRIVAAYLCDSSVINLTSMSCVPLDHVHRGNFTAALSPT